MFQHIARTIFFILLIGSLTALVTFLTVGLGEAIIASVIMGAVTSWFCWEARPEPWEYSD